MSGYADCIPRCSIDSASHIGVLNPSSYPLINNATLMMRSHLGGYRMQCVRQTAVIVHGSLSCQALPYTLSHLLDWPITGNHLRLIDLHFGGIKYYADIAYRSVRRTSIVDDTLRISDAKDISLYLVLYALSMGALGIPSRDRYPALS